MYNDVLYPHERLFYKERRENYHALTVSMFVAALGAELECLGLHTWPLADGNPEYRLEIQLDNLFYYGSYYALYA